MEESCILSSCALYLDFETKKNIDAKRRLNIEKIYNSKLKKKGESYILSINDEYKGQFNRNGFSIKATTSNELVSEAKKILSIFDLNLNRTKNAILKFNFINRCDDEEYILQQFEWIKEITGSTKLMISRVEFLEIIIKEEMSILVGISVSEQGLVIEINSKIDDLERISPINVEINNYVKSKLLKNIKKD